VFRLAAAALKYQEEQHSFRAKPLFALGLKGPSYLQWNLVLIPVSVVQGSFNKKDMSLFTLNCFFMRTMDITSNTCTGSSFEAAPARTSCQSIFDSLLLWSTFIAKESLHNELHHTARRKYSFRIMIYQVYLVGTKRTPFSLVDPSRNHLAKADLTKCCNYSCCQLCQWTLAHFTFLAFLKRDRQTPCLYWSARRKGQK